MKVVGSNPTQVSVYHPPDFELEYFATAPECEQPLLQVQEYFSNYNGDAGPRNHPTFFLPWRGKEIHEMWMVSFENPHMLVHPLYANNFLPTRRGLQAMDDELRADSVFRILEALGTSDLLLMYLAARDVRDNAQLLHVLNEVATSRKKDCVNSNPYLRFAHTYFRTLDGYKYCVNLDTEILEGLYWYFQYTAA